MESTAAAAAQSLNKGNFSSLQHLLQLSYSEDLEQQQRAAVDLARLTEGSVFPAVSFGPLAHALCRLVPSSNRTVVSYASKAVKLLILDDALRPQAVAVGVPAIVCSALAAWKDEPLCARELLGALQTLCWDKQCVKVVLASLSQAEHGGGGALIAQLTEFIASPDTEISILALATMANLMSYCDSLMLQDKVLIDLLLLPLPALLDAMRSAQHRSQRFYALAAVANASAHPLLAAALNAGGGLALCRDVERQSLANLHILGSKVSTHALQCQACKRH